MQIWQKSAAFLAAAVSHLAAAVSHLAPELPSVKLSFPASEDHPGPAPGLLLPAFPQAPGLSVWPGRGGLHLPGDQDGVLGQGDGTRGNHHLNCSHIF